MPFANDCLDSGFQTLRDVRNLTLDQATVGELDFILYDPKTGTPIDLVDYSGSSSSGAEFTGVKLTIKEAFADTSAWATKALGVDTETTGKLTLVYDAAFSRRAGIFTAQVELWAAGDIERVIPYFVTIDPNLRADSSQRGLSLSVAEVRMAIRDVDPEANYLLDELDFSDQEIALAIRRCVDYWNEAPPPVGTYKPTNFPWRYNLSLGVAALLHQTAANQKMRNDLPYAAGGLTIQDTVKYKQYLEFHERYWKDWVTWVKAKKYQLNIAGAYASLGSGYAYQYFYR